MSKKSSGGKIAAGLGIAALAAAAAGSYYFLGQGGKQHRQKAKAWAKAAKTDMLKKIKGMSKVSKQAYNEAMKEVMAKYRQARNVEPAELAALGRELKHHWDAIAKDVAKMGTKKPTNRKKAKR